MLEFFMSAEGQTIVAQNVDGSTRRQFSFVFAAQLAYSDEARNNIDNSGFYESFADWLERCTAGGKLPAQTGKQR